MPALRARRRRRAFTLVELLVVIAVLGVLASILIPVVARVRASAQSTHCMSNMQQLGRAFMLYAQDNRSLLPPPANPARDMAPWFLSIHPYTTSQWSSEGPEGGLHLSPVFSCPTWLLQEHQPKLNDIGYAMSAALGSTINPLRPVPISSLPNPSRAVVLLELTATEMPCFPIEGTLSDFGTAYTSRFETEGCDRHGGAANYLFGDGHVGHHTPEEARIFLH